MALATAASFRRPVTVTVAGRRELPRAVSGPPIRPDRRPLLLIAAGLAVAIVIAVALTNLLSAAPTEPPRQTSPVPSIAPIDAGSPAPPAAVGPEQGEPNDGVLRYLEATTVALVVMTLIGTVATAVRQQRRSRQPALDVTAADPSPVPGPAPLAVAAERGLAEVGDLSRGPREAIIACYAAMEQALAGSPGVAPQDSDTPSEVLARAVGNQVLRAGSATTLVEVFAEARFSTHVMTEGHREVAERALRAVLGELRQAAE